MKEKCVTFSFIKLNANLSCYLRTLFPAEAVAIMEKENTKLLTENERTSCLTNCRTIKDLGS